MYILNNQSIHNDKIIHNKIHGNYSERFIYFKVFYKKIK